uniref:Uncharacterized protein n=1 Tax=Oryza sativa subsp. japonica TaxID=39947 RepID=Q6K3K0_ORYSJ|nr:hypothetical protein [Oryza sativa Japonica Group]BAD19986.1 hypothetical protein [Oryza sativa Japonica Group]
MAAAPGSVEGVAGVGGGCARLGGSGGVLGGGGVERRRGGGDDDEEGCRRARLLGTKLYRKVTKTKVVDLDERINFVVDHISI